MSGFIAVNTTPDKKDETMSPLTADAVAAAALKILLSHIAEDFQAAVAPTSTTPTSSDTEPSQVTTKNKGRGVLADGKPSLRRRVRYCEVKEFKRLELCWENNEAVPDDLEAMIDKINHRVGHKMKPEYEKMMMDLRIRRWRAIEAKQADIAAKNDELEQEVRITREERKQLQEELNDAKYNLAVARSNATPAPPAATPAPPAATPAPPAATPAPMKSKRSNKKAEPPIARPENVTRRDTPVPMAAVAVLAPFDTIIETGVDAVVSGQRQRMEDWVKVAVGRDRPQYQ